MIERSCFYGKLTSFIVAGTVLQRFLSRGYFRLIFRCGRSAFELLLPRRAHNFMGFGRSPVHMYWEPSGTQSLFSLMSTGASYVAC